MATDRRPIITVYRLENNTGIGFGIQVYGSIHEALVAIGLLVTQASEILKGPPGEENVVLRYRGDIKDFELPEDE